MKNKSKENTKSKMITIFAISIIVVLIFIAVSNAFISDGSDDNTESDALISYDVPEIIDGYQEVDLYFINYEYKLVPENLIVDVPVRMKVDLETVYGCMRAVMIPAFSVRDYVTEQDNVIEFTPTKTGVFNIMCTMNMGRGKFRVVEG